MSADLTIGQICERALRKIGAYPIADSAADPEAMAETTYWLDMVVGHLSGSMRCFWLVPATISVNLTTGQGVYDFADLLGQSNPDESAQFLIWATVTSGGSDIPVKILRRREYDEIADKTSTGVPKTIYVDRLVENQRVYVHPVPGAGETIKLNLTIQRFNRDLLQAKPAKLHGLRSTWNLWLVTALAAEIGDGPVRRVPDGELRAMRDRANELVAQLVGYDAQEQAGEPRRVRFNDPAC